MIYISMGGGQEMPVEGDVVSLFQLGKEKLFRVGARAGDLVNLHAVVSDLHVDGAREFSFSEAPVMQTPSGFLFGTKVLFHGNRWENPTSGR